MSPLPTVLVAACEAGGVGLLGAGVLRGLRCRPREQRLAAVLVITALGVLVSAVTVLLLPKQDVEVQVLAMVVAALVPVGTGLLLGRSVLRRSPPRGPATCERLDAEALTRRQVVTWFAHDLSTPMARLREVAGSAPEGVLVDRSRHLAQLRDDVQGVTELVDDLYELCRLRTGPLPLSRALVALDELTGDAVAELSPAAAERGVRLRAGRLERALVRADRAALSRVLRELLTGAVRGGADVSAVTRTEAEEAVLVVSGGDHRGSPEGMAIAQHLVAAHRGSLTTRTTEQGTTVELRLPR